MAMGNIAELLISPGTDTRTRILAASNFGAFSFFCCVTFSVTTLCYFEIVSALWEEESTLRTRNYMAIIYIFIQTVGNFYLALTTDPTIAVLPKKLVRYQEKRRFARQQKMLEEEKKKGKVEHTSTKSSKDASKTGKSCTCLPEARSGENQDLVPNEKINVHEPHPVNGTIKVSQPEWHYCKICDSSVPPRAHHCVLCGICVLRRDHHCFFMCTCIGYTNQRYFIVFCIFMAIGGVYAVVLMAMYLRKKYKIVFSAFSLVLLLVDGITELLVHGPDAVPMFLVVILFYLSLFASLIAAGFAYWQIAITLFGQTTHEAVRGSSKFSKSCWENYKDVFGKAWFVCWFFPLPVAYLPKDYSKTNSLPRKQRKSSDPANPGDSSEEERSNERISLRKRKQKKS